ncbi:1,5-anhydro-D-fructose reductase-like [Artemia franciscana]|uniref:1,5-anhydro-D-fructose reductase-like n=1 Tax=Artemia franciscana TaxID=6661 RepID=UPI0032DAC4F8
MKDHVEFYNGYKMPILGLGTWSARPEEMKIAINEALKVGYRHFDTAFTYMNEESIGEVLAEWISQGRIKREELFIVTKLPMIGNRSSDVDIFLKESLKRLKLSYVDLYLIHAPTGLKRDMKDINNVFPEQENGEMDWDMDTNLPTLWQAMEQQVDLGLAKNIGLSNFNESQIRKIMNDCRIQPANNQVEIHAYFLQTELRDVCKEFGITVCAYSPLGSPGRQVLFEERGIENGFIPDILQNPVVSELAKKHEKTPAQILLRYLAQLQVVVIPKSTNPKRIAENFKIFDFELSPEDISDLNSLDQGQKGRTFDWTFFKGAQKHPEYPF